MKHCACVASTTTFSFFSATFLCTAGRILLGCPTALSLRPFWWPPHLQNMSLWLSPWSWRKEKSHNEQDRVNRGVVPAWQGAAGCSGRCELVQCLSETVTICPTITLVSSRPLSEVYLARSSCWLANCFSCPVTRMHCEWYPSHRRMSSIWLLTYCLGFGDVGDFHLLSRHLVSRSYSKIHISSLVMTLQSMSCSIWKLDNVLTHLHEVFHHSTVLASFLRKRFAYLNLDW